MERSVRGLDGAAMPYRRCVELVVEPLSVFEYCEIAVIKLKSLILAQIERWRHALHMQVERQRGSNPGGEWRTGE